MPTAHDAAGSSTHPVSEHAPLLPSLSIVDRTTRQARRAVAAALAGAALLIGTLGAEGVWLAGAHHDAALRVGSAQRAAGRVRLAQARMTAAAQMAAATGEARWVDAYDAARPDLEQALAEARSLAPPDAARVFDARTRASERELTNMHEAAFEAVNVGAPVVARAIFASDPYLRHTGLMGDATSDFVTVTVVATQSEIDRLERVALLATLALLAAVAGLGLLLWRGLSRRLEQSRSVFLDAEDRIQRLASSDLLTGLANRAALHDAMETAMARAHRDGHGLAVLMVDLDRFKPVNDRQGHMVGDLVLKEVALRLQRCVRSGEIIARYGGDEFVVVVDDTADGHAARSIGERLAAALAQPMALGSLSLSVGATVGIARFPADARHSDELLRKADGALYRAKAASRGGVCFYDRSLDEAMAERDALEAAMRAGIAAGEFVPFYQPIVDLADGRVRSLELLCRWRHPARGWLPPAEFIALAEERGLIDVLTIALLERACVELGRVPTPWRLSVNVAPQQIQDVTLVPRLLAVLRTHGVPPERLDIELTESALVSDTAQARAVMLALKNAGITVTLDDFGTGYSSLAYLAEMSFDRIKIDRSFVRTLHERAGSAKIVEAVVGLSRSLGVSTVAEGVETPEQAAALRALGCDFAQGWHFGKPRPIDVLADETHAATRVDRPDTAAIA